MRLKNNKSGFTLLEIIIVIIIVGVLASLALPRFFNTVEYARSTEALNVIGTIKRAADRCALAIEAATGTANDYGNCTTWAQLGMDDPGTVASSVFDYNDTPIAFAAPVYTIVATRTPVTGPTPGGETITFTYNVTSGVTARNGSGPYAGLR